VMCDIVIYYLFPLSITFLHHIIILQSKYVTVTSVLSACLHCLYFYIAKIPLIWYANIPTYQHKLGPVFVEMKTTTSYILLYPNSHTSTTKICWRIYILSSQKVLPSTRALSKCVQGSAASYHLISSVSSSSITLCSLFSDFQ
jgi:hypothetical protein